MSKIHSQLWQQGLNEAQETNGRGEAGRKYVKSMGGVNRLADWNTTFDAYYGLRDIYLQRYKEPRTIAAIQAARAALNELLGALNEEKREAD